MSFQAFEAVQDHSEWARGDENSTGFKIMLAIARFANKEGVAGVKGDHKKCPSVRALANVAHVHYNSVQNWIPLLVESGELTVDKYGKGRGSHQVYTINLPLDSPTVGYLSGDETDKSDVTINQNNVTSTGQKQDDDVATRSIVTPQSVTIDEFNVISKDVTKIMESLVTLTNEMSHMKQLMSQANVTNVTSMNVTDTDIDTDLNTYQAEPESESEPLKPITEPYGIYQRLRKIEPGIKKGQVLRDAKALINGDKKRGIPAVEPVDIIGCAKFMKTEEWRINNMANLTSDAIIQKIYKWIEGGRPKNWDEWQANASKTNGAHKEMSFD